MNIHQRLSSWLKWWCGHLPAPLESEAQTPVGGKGVALEARAHRSSTFHNVRQRSGEGRVWIATCGWKENCALVHQGLFLLDHDKPATLDMPSVPGQQEDWPLFFQSFLRGGN